MQGIKTAGLNMGMTFFLSFASLVYEFIIAQILTALVGGTILQYSITIAVYTFCLGIGSYLFTHIPESKRSDKTFAATEFCLTILAVAMPILCLYAPSTILVFGIRVDVALAYLAMIALGLLSGLELPFLLELSEKKGIVLGVDYIGMFAASLIFPWVLFPKFGLLPTALSVASLNLACALIIFKKNSLIAAGIGLAFLLIVVAGLYSSEINTFSTELFLGKYHV